jgi:hypothetical protein
MPVYPGAPTIRSPGRDTRRSNCRRTAAGVTQPLFDDTARQGLYQATKGIPRKVNKLATTALRLAAERQAPLVNEAILLDATAEALL